MTNFFDKERRSAGLPFTGKAGRGLYLHKLHLPKLFAGGNDLAA